MVYGVVGPEVMVRLDVQYAHDLDEAEVLASLTHQGDLRRINLPGETNIIQGLSRVRGVGYNGAVLL